MQDAALRTYFAAAVLLSRGHGFVSSHFIEPNAGHPKPSVLGGPGGLSVQVNDRENWGCCMAGRDY